MRFSNKRSGHLKHFEAESYGEPARRIGVRVGGLHRAGSRLNREQLAARSWISTVTLWVDASPPPAAVTARVEAPADASGETVKVRVTLFVLALAAGVSGFADHAADTPEGRPLTVKAMLPANDPPVTAVKATAAEPLWGTVTDCTFAASVNVGGSVAAPHSFTSNAPSTDPSPVARL